MKDYVRERRLRSREMFVPLVHSPGHAQADFGEAMAVIGGVARKVHFLAFDLPHSDACFVKAYPAETTEAFCDGHNAAVAFFGGVPRSILYDNTKLAVARILGDGKPSSGGGEDRGADPAEGDRSERRNHPDARGLLPRVPQSSRTRELGRCDANPLGERRHATRPGDTRPGVVEEQQKSVFGSTL